jgi:quercetin dioxygenase-like cupin family protein
MTAQTTHPTGEAVAVASLIQSTQQGSVLARSAGRNVTLFSFDAGQSLTEHTSPFDALVMVLEGAMALEIGGQAVRATPGTIVRMPAGMPHALEAQVPTRMLLVMLRE